MLFFITKRFPLLEQKCKKYCLSLGIFAKLVSIPIFFQKDGSLLKSPFIQLFSRMLSAFLLRDVRHALHDIFFCASLQSAGGYIRCELKSIH